MSTLKIVSVVNDFEKFNHCIKNNEYLKDFELIVFDNTVENIGIPERYNSFIDKLNEGDDCWIAFIHQDFMFLENPLIKLSGLSKNNIYGPVGITRQLFYLQFKPKFIFKIYRRCMLGEIMQGEGNERVGNRVLGNPKVKTFDCCCCIVHSSLIFQKKIRFDENLKFHMYVEDLCHAVRKKGIDSRIIQMDCRHFGAGCIDENLHQSANYVKRKHKISRISSTCFK